jgi:hypothetical protein
VEDKNPAEMQQVVDLLQKLGKVEVHYPVDLLAQRQAEFLNSVSAAQTAGSASTGIAASAKETLLHFVLGAVIVGELAVGAYVTRDLWLPLFQDEPVAIESNEIVDVFPAATEEVPTESCHTYGDGIRYTHSHCDPKPKRRFIIRPDACPAIWNRSPRQTFRANPRSARSAGYNQKTLTHRIYPNKKQDVL